jgi:hypothetical protein
MRIAADQAFWARPTGRSPDPAVADGGVRSPGTAGYLGAGGGAGAGGEGGQEFGHGGTEMPGGDGGSGGEGSPGSVLPVGSTAPWVRTAARYVDESWPTPSTASSTCSRPPSAPSACVAVATARGPHRAAVRVSNSGPVKRPDQVDGLLEPFRRLGTDRPAGDRGLGLGR